MDLGILEGSGHVQAGVQSHMKEDIYFHMEYLVWNADVGLAGTLVDKRKGALGVVYLPTNCDNQLHLSGSVLGLRLVFEVWYNDYTGFHSFVMGGVGDQKRMEQWIVLHTTDLPWGVSGCKKVCLAIERVMLYSCVPLGGNMLDTILPPKK